MAKNTLRIGCGSGFWGDTPEGARQLIEGGKLDYLVFDYLAEITMSILARMRERDGNQGYATDFVTQVIAPYAKQMAAQKLKVVVNAGGVNPLGCKAAIEKVLAEQGVALTVAAVTGDDVMAQLDQLRESGGHRAREMFSGDALPARPISANAYLGAFPIAAALAAGADIVVTGRCVDSALVLGPLIHAFGWLPGQYDLLASGSLAGHVIECGPQCTGGFSTDWEALKDGWADIGFPIVECSADGSFVVSKPDGTGGAVNRQTVSEQVTYEIGDPAAYVLPDVVCDFSGVEVREVGPDQVRVRGARGLAPTAHYKVSVTHPGGFRCVATLLVRGRQAAAKARAIADAILQRTGRIFERQGKAVYAETSVEVLGAEDAYGANASPHARETREVVLKLGVRHEDAKALSIFAAEIFPTSTSTVQGIAGIFGGRPKVQPVVRLFSFLMDKQAVPVSIHVGTQVRAVDGAHLPDVRHVIARPADGADGEVVQPHAHLAEASVQTSAETCTVPLLAVAYARSGDKGDISNIAVFARRPEFLALIHAQVTAAAVAGWMSHLARGRVERFDWPGLEGFNFLLHEALGGGGTASLRYDPQGKAHGQILLDLPVQVPADWMAKGWLNVCN
ncbi:MAG: DUF1446 domain-containing protein [Comamonadaceae bacterium]|nr:MAG: DUF1446 domain-containing protein [Comamonadaceae bacterium]